VRCNNHVELQGFCFLAHTTQDHCSTRTNGKYGKLRGFL
jgi:hypothetical protein